MIEKKTFVGFFVVEENSKITWGSLVDNHTSGIPADLQINLGAKPWAGGRNYL